MNNLRSLIAKRVKDRTQELTKLCCKLVQAGGENPPGNVSEVADVVEHFLEEEGILHERFEPIKGHANVLAMVGKGTPTLILCGHIDVVPAGNPKRWVVPPYSGEIREGKILGRGATDMKGGIAAMLMAAAILKDFENDFSGNAVFASVCDEEAMGLAGAPWLLENRKLSGNACLITEPTGYLKGGYTIVAGERGVCWLKITAFGKPSHGSLPMLGENAILRLTDFLPKLRMLEDSAVKVPDDAKALIRGGKAMLAGVAEEHGVLAKSLARTLDHYTVNLGMISGGTKVNVVPEKCEAEFDIRVPVGGNPDGVKEFIRSLLPENFECQIVNREMPSYTPASDPLIKTIQKDGGKVFGYRVPATFMAATSDAHRFREILGVPTVAFGPGYTEVAHAYNEFVYVIDVVKMAEVYANVIVDYLNLRAG